MTERGLAATRSGARTACRATARHAVRAPLRVAAKRLVASRSRPGYLGLMIDIATLLHDLVALPSVNPMGRAMQGPEVFEHQVTDYLEAFFRQIGVPHERQVAAPLRHNIVARCDIPGARRTLLFEVHQDTVPVDQMT